MRGSFEAGGASIRSHSALNREVYIGSTEHRGTVYDSRFVPPPKQSVSRAMIFLVVEGAIDWSAPFSAAFRGPVAFRLSSADYDGVTSGSRQTLRSSGERFCGIEVRFVTPELARGVERWGCSDAVWTAARRYLATIWQSGPKAAEATHAIALIRALEDEGVAPASVAASMDVDGEEPLGDLLNAMGVHYREFDFLPSLQAIASALDVSLRSLSRLLTSLWDTFPALPWSFRDLMLGVRIRFAVHMLSVEKLTIREIAKAAGYRHPEAMANAFKNAGIPSPRDVRAALIHLRAGG